MKDEEKIAEKIQESKSRREQLEKLNFSEINTLEALKAVVEKIVKEIIK